MKYSMVLTAATGNKMEFYRTDLQGDDQITVRDCDCQMERVYTVGQYHLLNDFVEPELIESVDQVIEAWVKGIIWF